MRAPHPALALILALAVAGSLAAAPAKKKPKDQSPPTAQPDSTLVAPDTTPPPQTFAAPTRPVEMQPIGTTGGTTGSLLGSAAPPATAAQPVRVAAPASPPPPPPSAPPPPPPEPPVIVHAEVCLRAQAPRAAKAETSPKLAVDLLLQDLCAGEVDAASLYAHNIGVLARFTPQSERTAAGLSGARVDPETGEIVNPPAGDVTGALTASGLDRTDVEIPPQMRRFAADLVLDAKAVATSQPPKPAEPHRGH